jgi:hypothetical protein
VKKTKRYWILYLFLFKKNKLILNKKIEILLFQFYITQKQVKSNAKEEKMSQQQEAATHTEVNPQPQQEQQKQSALSDEIKNLIYSGFCTDWSIQNYHKKSNNAFQKIKELLGDKTNTLSSKEIEDLCDTYRFVTYDTHGIYPKEDCVMLNLLRSATVNQE